MNDPMSVDITALWIGYTTQESVESKKHSGYFGQIVCLDLHK